MNEAAGHFSQHVLARQAIVIIAAFGAIAGLAPKLLLLDDSVAVSVLASASEIALLTLIATAVTSLLRLRAHRFVLRSLALGSTAIEPEELGALAALPRALTARFFFSAGLFSCLLLAPGLRPPMLDAGRAVSLVILSVTILGASAIPHYVLTRAATNRLFELSPEDPMATLLGSEELRRLPQRRMTQRLLLAVVAPVALVGVGAVLISHAHQRTFIEKSGTFTAEVIARAALEPTPGALSEAGRADAIGEAASYGFMSRIARTNVWAAPTVTRERDGQLTASAPIEDGTALVRFSATLDPAAVSVGALTALLAVAFAALLGVIFGRMVSSDLALATYHVRELGTDAVLRGDADIARPARFAAVADLGRAVEVLAERFRVFAAAQERALEAREAAQRMRGLLFASVSHDLKSPLNAILGLSDLLADEELTAAQRESLGLIQTRGRELLALIETILDAARVDSGQLGLRPKPYAVATIVSDAITTAMQLVPDYQGDIAVEVAESLPLVPVDPGYLTRAVGVIIAQALRTASTDPNAMLIRVRATLASSEAHVRIDVEHGSKRVPPSELEALFARQSSSRGRGLTLGLSLARSILELHNGSVQVDGASGSAPVAQCWIPLHQPKPGKRRRLSTKPALG